jgi:hypothetical protein
MVERGFTEASSNFRDKEGREEMNAAQWFHM